MVLSSTLLFRLLSDETRLRSLLLLLQEGELCVCELTYALGVIQPKVSRHLAALRDAGLVSDRRQGQWIYYRLHSGLPAWALAVLRATAEGVGETGRFAADRAALGDMPNRPGGRRCA